MLLANNLSFERSGRYLFKNLDLSVSSNKIIQIRGRNGIGKTTLIKILSNIMLPKSGDIYWNGKNIHKNSSDFFNNLSLVMDTNTSKNDMTVYENIKFWKNIFASPIQDKEIEALLEMLDIKNYINTFVKHLSYGEKRKLEMSRLIIEKKKLWIFDEPYLGLDKAGISILNETLEDHIKNGGMSIFSSHFNPQISKIEIINHLKFIPFLKSLIL